MSDAEVGAPRVGADLALARERLGRTLPEMAGVLRIRPPYLQALEEGRIEALPGRVYALAFLRTYAAALGLDADEAVRRFKLEAAEVGGKPALHFPAPLPERGLPAGALLLLGLVLVVGAYAGWYRLSGEGRLPAETVQPVPARLTQLIAPPPPRAGTPQAVAGTGAPIAGTIGATASLSPGSADAGSAQAAAQGQMPDQTPGQTPGQTAGQVPVAGPAPTSPGALAPGQAAGGALLAAQTAGAPGAVAPEVGTAPPAPVVPTPAGAAGATLAAASSTPPVYDIVPANVAPGSAAAATPTAAQDAAMLGGAAGGSSGLLVLATADAWVQVRSSAGVVLFSHLLHAGEGWPVPAGRHLSLTTGNAGGTVLVRNGVASPPLGATGAVLHNVPLGVPTAAAAPAPAASARP